MLGFLSGFGTTKLIVMGIGIIAILIIGWWIRSNFLSKNMFIDQLIHENTNLKDTVRSLNMKHWHADPSDIEDDTDSDISSDLSDDVDDNDDLQEPNAPVVE